MPVLQTYATVLLTGDHLARADVEVLLASTPSSYNAAGERIGNGQNVWPHGQWRLESTRSIDTNRLADHLSWLFEQIMPHHQLIQDIVATGVEGYISCFLVLEGFNIGVVFPPDLAVTMGLFGLEIGLDIYIETPDSDKDQG